MAAATTDGQEEGWLSPARAEQLAAEVYTVLAELRRNARFAIGGRRVEHPLVEGLKRLSRQPLRQVPGVQLRGGIRASCAVNPAAAFRPFLDIVASADANGPVTGEALRSICRLLEQGFLSESGTLPAQAMLEVCSGVLECRFEDTGLDTDPVVLLRLLSALKVCFVNPAGKLLPDEAIIQLARVIFSITAEPGRTKVLQTLAEQALLDLVRTVCRRLPEFEPEHQLLPTDSPAAEISSVRNSDAQDTAADGTDEQFVLGSIGARQQGQGEESIERSISAASEYSGFLLVDGPPAPYGVRAVQSLLEFAVELISPAATGSDVRSKVTANTATVPEENEDGLAERARTISLGFELAESTLAAAGGAIVAHHPKLVSVIEENLCLAIVHQSAAKSTAEFNERDVGGRSIADGEGIFSRVIRTTVFLIKTMAPHMRFPVQSFVYHIFLPTLQLPSVVSDGRRELVLHGIMELFAAPEFVLDTFAAYDCALAAPDVLHDLVSELVNVASADVAHHHGTMDDLQTMALHSLQMLFRHMAAIASRVCTKYHDCAEQAAALLEVREHKKRLTAGVTLFNRKPVKGLDALIASGLVANDPQSIAAFLRHTHGVSKEAIGEVFGEPGLAQQLALIAFLDTFDFGQLNFDNAIRLFLEAFRLPGEAQKIDRIMEAFAKRYFEHGGCSDLFASSDGAYVLAFSLIMLNTNQHNPQIKASQRMSLEDFLKNNREINDGKDFPVDFMNQLYKSINDNEIKMTVHDPGGTADLSFDLWVDFLRKSKSDAASAAKQQNPGSDCSPIGSEMLAELSLPCCELVWELTGQLALDSLFLGRCGPAGADCAVGFVLDLATTAAHCDRSEVLDELVYCLCRLDIALRPACAHAHSIGTESCQTEAAGELRARLVGSPRALLAGRAVATPPDSQLRCAIRGLIGLANRCGAQLRCGWPLVLRILLLLRSAKLLPLHFEHQSELAERFATAWRRGTGRERGGDVDEQDAATVATTPIVPPASPSFWTLSYWSGSSTADAMKTEEAVAAATTTCEAAEAFMVESGIDELVASCTGWLTEPLQFLSNCMVSEIRAAVTTEGVPCMLPPESSATKAQASSNNVQATKVQSAVRLTDDEAAFYVDLLRNLALQNNAHISAVWPSIATNLADVVVGHAAPNSALRERSLLVLLSVGADLAHLRAVQRATTTTLAKLAGLACNSSRHLGSRELCIVAVGLLQLLQEGGLYERSESVTNTVDNGAADYVHDDMETCHANGLTPWKPVFQLLEQCAKHPGPAAATGFETLRYLILDSDAACAAVYSDSFSDCVDAVLAYAESPSVSASTNAGAETGDFSGDSSRSADRAASLSAESSRISLNALDLLHMLPERLAAVVSAVMLPYPARFCWLEFVSPLLHGLVNIVCRDTREEVRLHALALLQTALVDNSRFRWASGEAWNGVVQRLLLPLLHETALTTTGPDMVATRLRALDLLGRTVARRLPCLLVLPDFPLLWARVLQVFEMHCGLFHSQISLVIDSQLPQDEACQLQETYQTERAKQENAGSQSRLVGTVRRMLLALRCEAPPPETLAPQETTAATKGSTSASATIWAETWPVIEKIDSSLAAELSGRNIETPAETTASVEPAKQAAVEAAAVSVAETQLALGPALAQHFRNCISELPLRSQLHASRTGVITTGVELEALTEHLKMHAAQMRADNKMTVVREGVSSQLEEHIVVQLVPSSTVGFGLAIAADGEVVGLNSIPDGDGGGPGPAEVAGVSIGQRIVRVDGTGVSSEAEILCALGRVVKDESARAVEFELAPGSIGSSRQ